MGTYSKVMFYTLLLFSFLLPGCANTNKNQSVVENKTGFIRVSAENPRYFETEYGKTWIPVMINLIMPNGEETQVLRRVESYFKDFSENGGNSMRIWISSPFLEIEDTKQGEYNPAKFQRIDRILEFAKKYNIRIKFTLQHIRTIKPDGQGVASWSNRAILSDQNGGTFADIRQYINTDEGKKNYINRARALSARYKDNKEIFSWELWNEMDAVDDEDWYPFSKVILDSIKTLFPNHLVAQTLGSLHSPDADQRYNLFLTMDNNDYFTVHRYLDPGNDWGQYEHVHGPIDLLVSQAVQFIYRPGLIKPVVPNEHGAVEGNHAGPNKLYPKDTAGVFIHDMIFTPFFCGASGCGAMWHWDSYVEKMNLWFHYRRFNNAIESIDPVREKFIPFTMSSDSIRYYGVRGEQTTMIWCRDALSNWMTELRDGILPEARENVILDLPADRSYSSAKAYDPWGDKWIKVKVKNNRVALPPFTRSLVVIAS